MFIGSIGNGNLRSVVAICFVGINGKFIIFVIRAYAYRSVVVKHAAAVALNGNIVNTQEEIRIVDNRYGRSAVSSNCSAALQHAAANVNVAAGYR